MEALDRVRESTLYIRQAANRIGLYIDSKYKCGDWSIDIKANVSAGSSQEGSRESGFGVNASVSIEESSGSN
jgi:hypothetical protein